jgi:hypothetical protein
LEHPAGQALARGRSGCLLPQRHVFESLRAIEEDLAPESTARWAVTPTATGACVWFEIRYEE